MSKKRANTSTRKIEARLAKSRAQAEKVLETFPDTLFGIPRPLALVMISGFAALVRDGVKDPKLREETKNIEAVCFEAALIDIFEPAKKMSEEKPSPVPVPPVNVTWPEAWMKYGGERARPA